MIPAGNDLPPVMRVRPEDLARGTVRLVVLPEILIRVDRMVDDPHSSGAELGALIGRDPALAARLLGIANSPFYGFPSRIHSLPRAVTVIGRRGLRDLILAASASDLFNRLGVEKAGGAVFWRHSLCCAIAARLLGLRCGISEPDGLFAAGLLHDIGKLVILDKLPEIGRQTQMRARDGEAPLHRIERMVIGCDHAEVGGELLRQWRLPADIWSAVRDHHDPARAEDATLAAAIVHVADLLAHAFLDPRPDAAGESPEGIAAPIRDLLALDARAIDEIRDEIMLHLDGLSAALRAA